MAKKKKNLKEFKVKEVSLVDSAANKKTFAIIKSEEIDMEEILKALEDLELSEVQKAELEAITKESKGNGKKAIEAAMRILQAARSDLPAGARLSLDNRDGVSVYIHKSDEEISKEAIASNIESLEAVLKDSELGDDVKSLFTKLLKGEKLVTEEEKKKAKAKADLEAGKTPEGKVAPVKKSEEETVLKSENDGLKAENEILKAESEKRDLRLVSLEKKEAHRVAVAKAEDLGGIAGDEADVVSLIEKATSSFDEDGLALFDKVMKAFGTKIEELEKSSGVFDESGARVEKSGESKLEVAASIIKKAQPELSNEQCVTKALEEDSSLYEG